MNRDGIDVARARRWFWGLVVLAVLAMSVLYRAAQAEPGAATGLAVLGSSLLVLGTTIQATRILVAVETRKPRKLRRRWRENHQR
jgi:uncharacterized membrane protein